MRTFYFLILISLAFAHSALSQIIPPYSNNFDNNSDTTGWSHIATFGIDDWELGTPSKTNFNSAYSTPNAWVTNLDSNYAGNSGRSLVTPFFDLSDTLVNYVLSFYQKRNINGVSDYLSFEYSHGINGSWQLLIDSNTLAVNWQGTSGFTGNYYSVFQLSRIRLRFIQGVDSIRFRFRFNSGIVGSEGWMIDNFSIGTEYFNIYAVPHDTIFVSQHCSNFTLTTTLGFNNQYSTPVFNTTNYYLSVDSILDLTDTLIASHSANIYGTITNWSQTLPVLTGLSAGNYYIFYQHDANDSLIENDESDNTSYAILSVDSVYTLPYLNDFEDSTNLFKAYPNTAGQTLIWELGKGYRHHLENTHSGKKAWHTSKSIYNDYTISNQFIQSLYTDLTSASGNIVLNFWFKNDNGLNKIQSQSSCNGAWTALATIPYCTNDEWDFMNITLNSFSTSDNFRFRFNYINSYLDYEGLIIDDVYLGIEKPDLSIEYDKVNRTTSTQTSTDSVKYYLTNSGGISAASSATVFYWSIDSVFDGSDVFLGTKQEQVLNGSQRTWTNFSFLKPTLSAGVYYIFYFLDHSNDLDEMRENNNSGYFILNQQPTVTVPYYNDFETQVDGWRHNSTLGSDDWYWGTPTGNVLDTAFSGIKTWTNSNSGSMSPMSRMHLYTPPFDFSSSTNPVLEFDMKLESHESCSCNEGKMNMSYSIDGGATWIVLDKTNESFDRWYYFYEYDDWGGIDDYYYLPIYSDILFDNQEKAFAPYNTYNSRDADRCTHYVLDLGFLAGQPDVQFRYNIASELNDSLVTNGPVEGALIDNFTIREKFIDLCVNYKKSLMMSSLSQKINFFMDVKNQGNYLSGGCVVRFYVSTDTILDASDYLLGEDNMDEIQPDLYFHLNEMLDAPPNLTNYNYLMYELDPLNWNNESSELNNNGYWNLALDSVSTFPYFQDFNDTIVDGWNYYCKNYQGNQVTGQYRFRNMVAPGEALYQSQIISGQMFTDRINAVVGINQVPFWYLTSPSFDFTHLDSILLSFDLMCVGNYNSPIKEGGNLQFSTDGGNNWSVLNTTLGQGYNWYNNTTHLADLNNELGWHDNPFGNIPQLDSTTFNLSFLSGEANVVFRFQYRCNDEPYGGGTVAGMRLDNFKISGVYSSATPIDYTATNFMTPVSATIAQPDFDITYSIINTGLTNGEITNTKFYWSADSIFNENDSLILTRTENPILSDSTLIEIATVTYPLPINQVKYYLFYNTDGDSTMQEIDETDNTGSFRITFDYNSVYALSGENLNLYVNENTVYVQSNHYQGNNVFTISLINELGQKVYSNSLKLKQGTTVFNLPNNLSAGIYLICLSNFQNILTEKILIVK